MAEWGKLAANTLWFVLLDSSLVDLAQFFVANFAHSGGAWAG
jgi:hypothetical protein